MEESDEAGAAWSSVEPEGEGGSIGIGFSLDEHVVDLPSWLVGVEVAGVDGDVGHALSGGRGTMGEETLSLSGRARVAARRASSNKGLIIYLFIRY